MAAIVAFFGASILMTGFPEGLMPNVSYPFVYAGDGLSHSWMAQRAIEGWIFDNPRSGFPFGSDFRDYPGADFGNLLIIKLLGQMGFGYQGAFNLFYLLTFSLVAVSSYVVARAFGINRIWAFCCALIYSFSSFHFQRLAHVFYAAYFVAPFFFYLCGLLYFSPGGRRYSQIRAVPTLAISLLLIALSSFGVYYALFGVILLSASAVAAAVKDRCSTPLWFGAAMITLVCVGVGLNIAPNLANKLNNGPNPEVAQRSPVEADIYSFKPIQLLLPQIGHRNSTLDSLAREYATKYSANENHTSNLGFIGSAGLVLLLGTLALKILGRSIDDRLIFLSALSVTLLAFGTAGGGGTIFSAVVSSSIRGWNRLSIFLLFSALLVFFFIIQKWTDAHSRLANKYIQTVAASFFLLFAYYDQTQPPCMHCNQHLVRVFSIDKVFYKKIEDYVGESGAVYQLPYIPFPESPVVNGVSPYDLLVGFLHTNHVHWSSGGMKGRQGDLFYRALAQESIEKQVQVIRKLGFRGVYVDKRAYPDFGEEIVAALTRSLGKPPTFEREFGEIVFFGLDNTTAVSLSEKSADDFMGDANYVVDHLGVRSHTTAEEGIEFSNGVWPTFIKNFTGLSGVESWGRWSDANLSQKVIFEMTEDLPSSFSLYLKASPYGRNGFQEVLVRVGAMERTFRITKPEDIVVIPFQRIPKGTRKIEFIPSEPVSPKELGASDDSRKLGIGFIELRLGAI